MAGNNNADISSQTIATTYDQVLHIGDTGNLSGCGAGNEKYIVDGSGTASTLSIGTARVGIGTDTPTRTLQVETNTDNEYVAWFENTHTTGNGVLVRGASGTSRNSFVVQPDGGATSYFIVRGDGNVGIGTASPDYQLQVEKDDANAEINITATGTGIFSILSFGDEDDDNIGHLRYDHNNNRFELNTSAGSVGDGITVNSSNNVGIGTATPNYMLDVETSGAIPSVRIGRNDASTGNIMGNLIFGNSTDDYLAGITAVEDGATDSGMLKFLVEKTGEGANYAMVIKSDGNVGIGTDTPGSLLEVRGGTGGGLPGGAGILTLSTGEVDHIVDGDVLGLISFSAPVETDGTVAQYPAAAIWAEAEADFTSGANPTSLVFTASASSTAHHSNVERMRITYEGNVGIGESSPAVELDVAGRIAIGNKTELTIATGVITITQSYHTVDTESDASSDALVTINGGLMGTILVIQAAHSDRSIVATDNTGNLRLAGDFTMDSDNDILILISNGTNWFEISRSNNGG